jgi:hypothetical protein
VLAAPYEGLTVDWVEEEARSYFLSSYERFHLKPLRTLLAEEPTRRQEIADLLCATLDDLDEILEGQVILSFEARRLLRRYYENRYKARTQAS